MTTKKAILTKIDNLQQQIQALSDYINNVEIVFEGEMDELETTLDQRHADLSKRVSLLEVQIKELHSVSTQKAYDDLASVVRSVYTAKGGVEAKSGFKVGDRVTCPDNHTGASRKGTIDSFGRGNYENYAIIRWDDAHPFVKSSPVPIINLKMLYEPDEAARKANQTRDSWYEGFLMSGTNGWVKVGSTNSGKCVVLLYLKFGLPAPYTLLIGTNASTQMIIRWTSNEDLAQKAFDHWLERGILLDGLTSL